VQIDLPFRVTVAARSTQGVNQRGIIYMTTYPLKNHRLADSASLVGFLPFSSAVLPSYTLDHVGNSEPRPRSSLVLGEF
jgi:hypothetical protein